MPSAREAVQSVLDDDRKLQEKKQGTIRLLLEERGEIDKALKALGHIEGSKPKTAAANTPKSPCKICKSPDHDGRFHRRKDAAPAAPPKPTAPQPKAAPPK